MKFTKFSLWRLFDYYSISTIDIFIYIPWEFTPLVSPAKITHSVCIVGERRTASFANTYTLFSSFHRGCEKARGSWFCWANVHAKCFIASHVLTNTRKCRKCRKYKRTLSFSQHFLSFVLLRSHISPHFGLLNVVGAWSRTLWMQSFLWIELVLVLLQKICLLIGSW